MSGYSADHGPTTLVDLQAPSGEDSGRDGTHGGGTDAPVGRDGGSRDAAGPDTAGNAPSPLLRYAFDAPLDPFRNSGILASGDGSASGAVSFQEDPQRGGVLDLAGGHLTVQGFKGVLGSAARTVALWVATTAEGSLVQWGDVSPGWSMSAGFDVRVGRTWEQSGLLCVSNPDPWGGHAGLLSVCGSETINDGKWHHVAVVASTSSMFDLRLLDTCARPN